MRILIFFFLTFLLSYADAFEYQIQKETLIRPSFIDQHFLEQRFQKFGFNAVSSRPLIKTNLPFDRVFVSDRWKKSLLLKAGLQAPASIEGQVLQSSDSEIQAFHFTYEGTAYLLIAINLSKDELENIVRPWLRNQTTVLNLFIPSANAAVSCDLTPNPWSKMTETVRHIESETILRSIGRCSSQALEGAKNTAADTLDFFKKLAKDPRGLWSEMKTSYEAFKSFTLNFKTDVEQILSTLGILSTEQKAQIACTISGEILTSALAGAGLTSLPRLLPTLTLKMKQVAQILAETANLEKKGIKVPNKQFLTHEALRCAK